MKRFKLFGHSMQMKKSKDQKEDIIGSPQVVEQVNDKH
jgi:hypothetical protein